MTQTIYDFVATNINGQQVNLSAYKDKVLLIVNTASKCGFTKQYRELEQLYERYKEQGLVVLGFPCNQFGSQEPGDEAEIKKFCSLNYNVTFPLFAKIDVNGETAHPVYKYLKSQRKGILGIGAIKWNFTKFLLNQQGEVIERFAPTTAPLALANKIEMLLK
jgi:glutathione peroxidase